MSVFAVVAFSGAAIGGTSIEQDPKGFYGIAWGDSLAIQEGLKKIDISDSTHVYTIKQGNPQIEGIHMESVKLYGIKNQYARALFRYQGEATHKSLLQYLETRFGKYDRPFGRMMRGLNQQYTWRGDETEITITYHGFRERGFLTAESRVLAPQFLNSTSDHSH